MTKAFEYLVVTHEVTTIDRCGEEEEVLNRLGAEGWELVSLQWYEINANGPKDGPYSVFYLKRERRVGVN